MDESTRWRAFFAHFREVECWQNFFAGFRAGEAACRKDETLPEKHETLQEERESEVLPQEVLPDAERTRQFFKDFRKSYADWRRLGMDFNLWELAGLNRDERKITGILAWLLDPNGSHGQEGAFLAAFLGTIPASAWSTGQKPDLSRPCRVQTEVTAGESGERRLDIRFDATSFLLVVEVKVDALEHDNQLAAYRDIARREAGSKPWALVYLTPDGREGSCSEAFSLRWKTVGQALNAGLRKLNLPLHAPARLACTHFCDFVESL